MDIIASASERVVLTRAPTFVEKARLFPKATFLVGADTITRIGDPSYYGGDPAQVNAAVEAIAQQGCRFLVFGRLIDHQFSVLGQLSIPRTLRRLCTPVSEAEFRLDLSSTELRARDD